MANPREILKKAIVSKGGTIKDLISKVFSTRNALHLAHWSTKNDATHRAVGSLYDDIVEEVDNIVECYQGEFGVLDNLMVEGCTSGGDILVRIKNDADWIKNNCDGISNGSGTIDNLLYGLLAKYNKTIYKLTNLS